MRSNEVWKSQFVRFSDSYNQLQVKLQKGLRIKIRGGMGLIQSLTTKKYFLEGTNQ